jgi:energy-coupling factor transporter ATP-binding protein EcfA2
MIERDFVLLTSPPADGLGQKQRVSLARVAYAAPDIVLCDDPLSALDASTGRKIFDQLFDTTRSTLLRSSAIVLVTHAAHFLNRVDEILVAVDGSVKFRGNWGALTDFKSDDSTAQAAIDFIRSSVQESGDHILADDSESFNLANDTKSDAVEKKNGDPDDSDSFNLANDTKNDVVEKKNGDLGCSGGNNGSLMVVETRVHGLSSLQTWLLWFKNAGGLPFLVMLCVFMTLDRLAYVGTEVWLSLWTEGHDATISTFGKEFPPQTEGRSAQYQYLAVYGIILAISFISTFLR